MLDLHVRGFRIGLEILGSVEGEGGIEIGAAGEDIEVERFHPSLFGIGLEIEVQVEGCALEGAGEFVGPGELFVLSDTHIDGSGEAGHGELAHGGLDSLEIDDRVGKIEMFEEARVKRGGDEVAGNYIFVDQRSDFFTVRSDKSPGKAEGEGRVRAILQPKAAEKK